jgi:DNA-binding XRE family transcriptional regulator
MSRRPATLTQADLARVIRAAKQAGVAEVELHVGDAMKIVVRITPSTDDKALEPLQEVIL